MHAAQHCRVRSLPQSNTSANVVPDAIWQAQKSKSAFQTEQQSLLQPTCAFTNLMTLAMLTARGRHSTRNWMLAFSWASRSLDRVLPEGSLLSCRQQSTVMASSRGHAVASACQEWQKHQHV